MAAGEGAASLSLTRLSLEAQDGVVVLLLGTRLRLSDA